MNYKDIYQQKLTTPEEAVKLVEDGWRVTWPVAVGQPAILIDALVRRKDEFTYLEILTVVDAYPTELLNLTKDDPIKPDYSYCIIGRRGVQEGRFTYTPARLSQIPMYIDRGRPYQCVMMQVSPMDEFGYFSMGLSCDYAFPVAKKAEKIIVQVNENMPRTFGRNFWHVTEVDAIVEANTPLTALPVIPPNENETRIGNYIAELVEDGFCLQLGIGSIPSAVALALENKKDLGVHTEMFPDAIKILWEKGVITNRKKNYNPDVSIASFALGSEDLYKWLNNNPSVLFYSVDQVLNPANLAQNDKMVCINSGLEVDLTGQVNSESIGHKQYTHTGGQQDLIMGAFMSKGGKGIIALESTVETKKGRLSKIVPHLSYGAFVSTGRNDVQYIVTEYGIADLKIWSVRERAKRLIAIAHPDFRDELKFEAEKAGFI